MGELDGCVLAGGPNIFIFFFGSRTTSAAAAQDCEQHSVLCTAPCHLGASQQGVVPIEFFSLRFLRISYPPLRE